jgi:hypothetical protein
MKKKWEQEEDFELDKHRKEEKENHLLSTSVL